MHKLPKAFIERIKQDRPEDFNQFLDAIVQKPITSIRYNKKYSHLISTETPIPWCTKGVYLKERPVFTIDPFFHAGCYYPQEAGSMILDQIQFSPDKLLKVLDLCAAPGGKTTLIYDKLPLGSVLVANEVIPKRAEILRENLIKWGCKETIVTCTEPYKLGKLKHEFDVILVDAPCSGEGMFRKDPKAITEWNPSSNKACSKRQKSILDAIIPALKPGGMLIYSTCTYSDLENEQQVERLIEKFGFTIHSVDLESTWNFEQVKSYGWRTTPHKTNAEGFFFSVLISPIDPIINNTNEPESKLTLIHENKLNVVNDILNIPFVGFTFLNKVFYASDKLMALTNKFRDAKIQIVQTGVFIARFENDVLIHEHHLITSGLFDQKTKQVSLSLDESLKFLKGISIPTFQNFENKSIVTYNSVPLGFARTENQHLTSEFPKKWQIRMNF